MRRRHTWLRGLLGQSELVAAKAKAQAELKGAYAKKDVSQPLVKGMD